MNPPASLPPALPVGLLPALGGLLGAFGLGSYAVWLAGAGLGTPAQGWDFRAYYAAGHALLSGGNLYDLGSASTPFYLYPPLLAFLLLPLSALTLPAATLIWTISQQLCLLAAGVLLLRLTDGCGLSRSLRGGLLLFLWGTGVPLRDEVFLGQVNSLVLLLLLGALVLASDPLSPKMGADAPAVRRSPLGPQGGRLLAAGLLLGLAISIKVQPVVLLPYFVLRGRWRLALAGGGAFVLLQAITIPFTAGTLDYWLNLFPSLPGRAMDYIDNQSINGLAARWLLPAADTALPQVGNHPTLWRITDLGGTLLVLGLTAAILLAPWIAARRGGVATRSLPGAAQRLQMLLEIGLLLIAVNITSYLTWPHHEIAWVLPALALLGWWTQQGRVPLGGALALGVVAVIFTRSPSDWLRLADIQTAPLWAAFLSGMHLYALGLLWLVLAATVLRALPSRAYQTNAQAVVAAPLIRNPQSEIHNPKSRRYG